MDLAAPHRAEPVENLDSRGDSDHHRGDGEETVRVGIHSDGEHVVSPDAHADESDANGGANHDRIPEDRLAGKDRNDFGDERKARNDQDVDLWMTEDPEEVHPDRCRAARLGVEEMTAEIAVDEQHDLRGG